MSAAKVILRGSNRLREGEKLKILDESARKRRLRKMFDIYDGDNFHDDPHADLIMSKKIPRFEDNLESRSRNKKKERTPEYYQMKYRKNFQQLVEEDKADAEQNQRVSYMDIATDESDLPARHFCAVCGYFSKYICIQCGTRYCSIRCMHTHMDTRCLKGYA